MAQSSRLRLAQGRKIPSVARLAWFSPMPPVATGIARCSADLVEALAGEHEIDVFVDERNTRGLEPVAGPRSIESAHAFVWQHGRRPFDLVVYQLGNSSYHNYQWPYLFRYPGLVVLHDAHLHHARAANMLLTCRADDYRREFAWNHPNADPAMAELAARGFDNHLHYFWPMTRLVARTSRVVAVHTPTLARWLRDDVPDARVEALRLGHGKLLTDEESVELGARARARHAIPPGAFVFGCYGALTPDKRLPQILAAVAATRAYAPAAHLLLAGASTAESDLRRDIARHGLAGSCTLTGYLETDDEFTACIAAADVSLNLRWPTAREVSGPWLRSLAAGKPTVTIDLEHMAEVPSVDPRTWRTWPEIAGGSPPCTVSIDIVDEDHSLRLALRRLATDVSFRTALGQAARRYWLANHALDVSLSDYRRAIARALAEPVPRPPLPPHLLDNGSRTLAGVMSEFGLPSPLRTFEVDF
jgi:glycosyltransferase involved in cell wall biosynthesis